MRVVSKMTCTMRQKRKSDAVVRTSEAQTNQISFEQYCDVMKTCRICKNLRKYKKHLQHIQPHKSAAKCTVYGVNTFKRCQICNVALHNLDTGQNYALKWHSEAYLGLCFKDRKFMCIQ